MIGRGTETVPAILESYERCAMGDDAVLTDFEQHALTGPRGQINADGAAVSAGSSGEETNLETLRRLYDTWFIEFPNTPKHQNKIQEEFDMQGTDTDTLRKQSVNYIKQLCGMTGTAVSGLPAELDFTKATIEPLPKSSINRIFFEFKRTLAASPKPQMAYEVKAELNTFLNPANELERLRDEQQEMRTKVTRKNNELQKLMSAVSKHEILINAIKHEVSLPFAEVVQNIVDQGKWNYSMSLITSAGRFIEFNTANDVIIRWLDRDAKIDHVVNMGKFMARINLTSFTMNLLPCNENIKVNGHYHPHLNTSGTPCWGNAANTVVDAFRRFQLTKLLDVAFTLLHEYNPESPYVTLDRFIAEKPQDTRFVPAGRIWFFADATIENFDLESSIMRSGRVGPEYVIELSVFKMPNESILYICDDNNNYILVDITRFPMIDEIVQIELEEAHEDYGRDEDESEGDLF